MSPFLELVAALACYNLRLTGVPNYFSLDRWFRLVSLQCLDYFKSRCLLGPRLGGLEAWRLGGFPKASLRTSCRSHFGILTTSHGEKNNEPPNQWFHKQLRETGCFGPSKGSSTLQNLGLVLEHQNMGCTTRSCSTSCSRMSSSWLDIGLHSNKQQTTSNDHKHPKTNSSSTRPNSWDVENVFIHSAAQIRWQRSLPCLRTFGSPAHQTLLDGHLSLGFCSFSLQMSLSQKKRHRTSKKLQGDAREI